MFDEPCLPSRNDWKTSVRPGDVILFAFPIRRAAPGEGPKTRPCVVLDVATVCGERHLLLAYGTSVDTPANRGDEVVVTDAGEILDAGVDKPTRFVGARRMVVPLDHSGFATGCGQRSPIIGRLTGDARQRLDVVRSRIAATAALAAQGRAARQGRSVASRVVIVEYRRLGLPRPGGRGCFRPAGNPADRR